MQTIKQRMVLRRRPRRFPIGTVRQWEDGSFIKVGEGKWQRIAGKPALGVHAPNLGRMRAGTDLLVDAITASKDRKQAAELAALALEALPPRPVKPRVVSLADAIAEIYAESGEDMAWQLYCARRWAKFNPDGVDMAAMPKFVERAKAAHGGKIPEGL